MKGFGYLVKEGFRNVYANRIMSIASICVLVSCLVMTGAAALFSLNVRNIVDKVEKTNETTVYILKDRSELEAKQIGTQLVAIANVEGVTFISKHVAVEQFKDTLGEQLFNMIKDRDPLNDTYRVSFKDLTKYDETVNQIRQIDGVQSVTDRRSFAHKLATVSSLVNWVSFGIVAALILYLCGVIREDIIADYMVSNIYNTNGINKMLSNIPEAYLKMIPDMNLLKECFDSRPERMIELLEAFEERDIRGRLAENGFSAEKQEMLKAKFTEKA